METFIYHGTFDIFAQVFRNQPVIDTLLLGREDADVYIGLFVEHQDEKRPSASVSSTSGSFFEKLPVETQDEIVRLLPLTERRERAIKIALEQVDNAVNQRLKEILG